MKGYLPAIQSLWIGDTLSNLERLCVQSFLDHGHEFHLYAYADVDNVPESTTIKDGNEILPYSQLTGGKVKHTASLSDYFRYALLNQKGGYWVDMDIICLRPFDMSNPIILIGMADDLYCFENCILRFPAEHPLMKTMQELCRNRLQIRGLSRTKFGGPSILTEQVFKLKLQHLASLDIVFSPSRSHEVDYFNATYRDGPNFPAGQYALHLLNHTLTKMGIDKNAQFDAESLYEQLKSRHGISQVAGARRVTATEINALNAGVEKQIKTKRYRGNLEKVLLVAVVILAVALGVSFL